MDKKIVPTNTVTETEENEEAMERHHCHHVQKLLETSPASNLQCNCQHVETLMRDVLSFITRVNQHEGRWTRS